MSTVEASATADAAEAAVRTKTYSPRTIPVFGVVTQHEDSQGIFKPMDLNHIIKLLEETDKDDLEEKQLDCVKKLVHCYQNGFFLSPENYCPAYYPAPSTSDLRNESS